MNYISIEPQMVLSTRDFPVHNEHILKIYFRMCLDAVHIVPPTPVMPMNIFQRHIEVSEDNKAFLEYIQQHPYVQYVMLDGSHKTTALTLTKQPIHSMVITSDADILEVKKKEQEGEIFSFSLKEKTIPELVNGKMAKKIYENDHGQFYTIYEKTLRMIRERCIPEYMIKAFLSE